ncbi:Zn-ribbon domain-containing OB-fold protein [Hydrogenophaga sp.]|uniref:Zn-ribbon domain-containing OB-fold protein n=1 Tax=Hydrogenophaga sp. TaxID=1904254 RepID=UPI0026232BD1|nr:Zn-ribbon domain-containing OB-fold protein [Hydrogenophaga sp.]MCW5653323.1 Zn-ribbon domain-containing OB-fold protein [Hydrogenophaga sp.]
MSSNSSATRAFISPGTNVENQPFWDGAAAGRFLLKTCKACGHAHFYPRAICPHCFSDQTAWQESAGLGTIYSYSVMRRVEVPYAIAYVTLDEGVTVMSNIVDADLDKLAIGQRVKVAFRPSEGGVTIPVFTPA